MIVEMASKMIYTNDCNESYVNDIIPIFLPFDLTLTTKNLNLCTHIIVALNWSDTCLLFTDYFYLDFIFLFMFSIFKKVFGFRYII
jgi:hypothetical protein